MKFRIRNYLERDLELIVILINAIDSVDRIEDGTTVEEVRQEFGRPGFNPTENVLVVEDDKERIVAYAGLQV
jgi:hypothetical protein